VKLNTITLLACILTLALTACSRRGVRLRPRRSVGCSFWALAASRVLASVESGNLDGATVTVRFDKEKAGRYKTSKF